ncbi:MAG: diguanylate cyclase [Cyanobacteriota bacterium]|nr:diguanylate cyclase [Cyanobacteriota bacterium]
MSERRQSEAEQLQEMEQLRAELATLKQERAEAFQAQEITRRQLQQRETELADIQRIAKLGFWRFDIASGRITWSTEIYQIFGRDPQSPPPSYEWLVQAIRSDYREPHQVVVDSVIATGQTQEIEYPLTRADGSAGWVWTKIEAVLDDQGQVAGLQGVAMDISERKLAEIALGESEARFRNLFDSNIVGTYIANLQGEIPEANDRFLQMVGYSREEFALGLVRWDQLTPPEYAGKDQEIVARLLNRETTEPWQKEYYCKDGGRIPVIIGVASLEADLNQVICLVLDMTEQWEALRQYQEAEAKLARLNSELEERVIERTQALQQSEERLRLAFEAANMGHWDWDILNNQIVWSENLERIMGLEPGGFDGNFETVMAMIHPDDRERVLRAVNQSTLNHEPYDLEFRFIKPDGGIRWAVSRASVMRDPNGSPIRMIGVDVDITRQKRFEEELRQVNQELEDNLNELKQRNAEMVLLSGIIDYLQSCSTVKDACAVISALSQPLFPDCSGGIFILAPQKDYLERVTFWGNPVCSDDLFTSLDCWALRRGRPHWVGQGQHDLFCNHVNHQHLPAESLCLPLIAQGETLGLLSLCAFKDGALPEIRQQLAKTVTEQLSLAIANLRLREQLQEQSLQDPLTALFNRRYLEQFLIQELARAKRHRYSVGVLMMDIDRFKNVNDTFGHEAGDRVLTAIGALLKEHIRASDVACRYGGEEMTVILPDTSLADASQKAEFLRRVIAALRVKYGDLTLDSVTASFGVACYPDHGERAKDLLQAADQALYRAKAAGRNQVVVAETQDKI